MQTRSSNENSASPFVCLSVKRVICDKMQERSVQTFLYHTKDHLAFKAFIGLTILAKMIGTR